MLKLVVLSVLLVNVMVYSADIVTNWNPFTEISNNSPSDSTEIMKSLPMHRYWDVGKARFRTGILAEFIEDKYPEFLSKMDIRITRNKQLLTVKNVSVIDPNIVLSHMLASIQYLAKVENSLELELHELIRDHERMHNQVNKLLSVVKQHNMTAAEMASLRDLVNYKTQFVIKAIEEEKLKYKKEMENIQKIYNDIVIVQSRSHGNLNAARLASRDRQAELQREKFRQLSQLTQKASEAEVEADERSIEADYNSTIAALTRDVQRVIESSTFRIAEQYRADRANEDVRRNIRTTSSRLSQRGLERVVDTLVTEIRSQAWIMFGDAETVSKWAVALLLLFLVTVTALEVGKALLRYLMLRLAPTAPRVLTSTNSKQSVSDEQTNWTPDTLSLDPETRLALKSLIHKLEIVSKIQKSNSQLIPLPIVLLQGQPGCGKSLVAAAVLGSLTKSNKYIEGLVVTGGELSGNASARLRELLLWAERKGCQLRRRGGYLVLIMEGMDEAIQDRLYSRTAGGLQGGLPLLLEALRRSSPNVCYILTTELPLSEVDVAMKDRVDVVLQLDRPNQPLRKLHLLREAARLLLSRDSSDHSRKSGNSAATRLLDDQSAKDLQTALLRSEESYGKAKEPAAASSPQPSEQVRKAMQSSTQRQDSSEVSTGVSYGHVNGHHQNNDMAVVFEKASRQSIVTFLETLAVISEGWSFRALSQCILTLQTRALGEEDCKLTEAILNAEMHHAQEQQRRFHSNPQTHEVTVSYDETYSNVEAMEGEPFTACNPLTTMSKKLRNPAYK